MSKTWGDKITRRKNSETRPVGYEIPGNTVKRGHTWSYCHTRHARGISESFCMAAEKYFRGIITEHFGYKKVSPEICYILLAQIV